ncbi:uncharacterized protein BKA78DRAFT_54828 [Phyllosticta capitalensis]|uniref:uncharacterized protein n=1 Tax=Phyllosticta capitalensis TaxID=121624 RepID=UPI003131F7E7
MASILLPRSAWLSALRGVLFSATAASSELRVPRKVGGGGAAAGRGRRGQPARPCCDIVQGRGRDETLLFFLYVSAAPS